MIMKEIEVKHILIKNKDKSWFGTDYTINLYRGCCHGCIYCDSRSVCYKIDNFDEVTIKKDALRILRDDLSSKRKKGVIAMGSMSDPYNPFEKKLCLTRHALELIDAYGFGVSITTKSDLILRDIDILKQIASHSPVIVKITITTPYDELSKIIEPNVCESSKRFNTIKILREHGIYSGILLMPCLPMIEDNFESVKKLVDSAKEVDARFIYPFFGVTLREGSREYFYDHLNRYFPNLKDKYIQRYGNQYICHSNQRDKMYNWFSKYCDSFAILTDMNRISRAYHYGYQIKQMKFDI